MKITESQKSIILLMREYDPVIINLRDGYWFTGGHGIKVNGKSCEALRDKGIIGYNWKLTELGKTIKLWRKHKTDTALLVTNISQYIEGKRHNENITFIITPEGNFYNVQGLLVNADYFESCLMPAIELQSNQISKGKHLDSRYIQ